MHGLEELKYQLVDELEKMAESGEIDRKDLPLIDMLAHTTKNLCKIIEDEEGGFSRRSYYGGSYEGEPYNSASDVYEGGSRAGRGGMSYGNSYRRRRDSMGRYSRAEGGNEEMVEELKGVIRSATDESTRYKLQQLVDKMQKQ